MEDLFDNFDKEIRKTMKELKEMLKGGYGWDAFDGSFAFPDMSNSELPDISRGFEFPEGAKKCGISFQKSESQINGQRKLDYRVSLSDGKNSLKGSYDTDKDAFELEINGLRSEMTKQEFESRLERYQKEGFAVFEK